MSLSSELTSTLKELLYHCCIFKKGSPKSSLIQLKGCGINSDTWGEQRFRSRHRQDDEPRDGGII